MKKLLALTLLFAAMPSLADGNLFLSIPGTAAADLPKASQDRLGIIKARKTSKDVRLYNVNPAALSGETTTMALGDAPPVVASMRSFVADPNNPRNFVWSGVLQEVPGNATFVVRDNKITGTIRNGTDLYRVESLGNSVHAIIEVDSSKFPPEEPPAPMEDAAKDQKPDQKADQKDASAQTMALGGISNVDVLVAFTPAAAKAVSDIEALIELALKESNDSYLNSDIKMKLTIVSSFKLEYTEASDYLKVLSDFSSNPLVRQRRDASGADLAVLIIDKSDYCGMATGIGSNAQNGFAIVYHDCATGYYSFAHELGHLMGARHDPRSDPATQPNPHAHGYQYIGETTRWRTIMAYDCNPHCPRLQYWSNPNKKYNGVPMGVANVSDNARMLNTSAPDVAQYRKLPAGDVTAAKK